jgi:NADH-quinone oxidoreductase subunit M
MENHILSIMTFLPFFVAMLVLIFPLSSSVARNIGFITSLAILVLSIFVYSEFEPIGTMQFIEHAVWIESYGIDYIMGIDGFSLMILMLIALLIPSAYLMLWDGRTKGYWASLLLIQAGITGTLCSLDLVLFYFFWETMLLPVFLIIGVYGTGDKISSTIKVLIYTIMGSLFMFIAILYLGVQYYYQYGGWSFYIGDLSRITIMSADVRMWLFVAFMLAFAIKIPLFPFHTWIMKTYADAPTGGVFLLSAIMAKLGVYGVVRFMPEIFPDVYRQLAPYFVYVGIFGLFYFGIAALSKKDIKEMFAYSSASHLSFIVAGIFTLNIYGFTGSLYLIIAHALATGGLFLLVGSILFRTEHKDIDSLGGLAKVAPLFTLFFMLFLLCIVGLPSTNGFVSELLIIIGLFKYNTTVGVISAATVIIAASFMFYMFGKVMLQKPSEHSLKMVDLDVKQIIALTPMVIFIFVMGLYPDIFVQKFEPTLIHMLEKLQVMGG